MSSQVGASLQVTTAQELLLRAALLQGEPARRAFYAWQKQTDLEQALAAGTYDVLPLLYHNLAALGMQEDWLSRFKGVYRREWYKNQTLFRAGAPVPGLLQTAGIETMLLGGAPLALLYYQDYGLRPLSKFDVLVPTAKRRAAIELLTRNGWKPIQHPVEKLSDDALGARHAWGFKNAAQQQFDLHWHVLIECFGADADDDFWAHAVPVRLEDVETRTLNPTDQLLYACVHDATRTLVPPSGWIPDAMMILRHAALEMDWTRLGAQAKKFRQSLRLSLALRYLREKLDAPIPLEFLQELDQIPVSDAERKLYTALAAPPTLYGMLPVSWRRYAFDLQMAGETNPVRKWIGFPRYLQQEKMLTAGEFVQWILSRSAKRIGNALRGVDQSLP